MSSDGHFLLLLFASLSLGVGVSLTGAASATAAVGAASNRDASGSGGGSGNTACRLRSTKYGKVCVCTATYCDYLENPRPLHEREFALISSSKSGLRFSPRRGQFGSRSRYRVQDHGQGRTYASRKDQPPFDSVTSLVVDGRRAFLQFAASASSASGGPSASIGNVHILVNRTQRFQKIVGFGGAFTGSVSHLLTLLGQPLQDQVYKSYFHRDGIGFNLLRIPIAGCDFDLEPWAYNEWPPNDATLSNFTKLDPRDELKVKQLQRLKTVARPQALKIKAAAWSSPTWMKSNNRWTGYSHLKPEYYQAWADYHLRYLELMAASQVPIWAISTGNEPLNGVIGFLFIQFMSLGWTPRNQAIWLNDHLAPTIRSSKFKDVLILGNDDQRYTYPGWFRAMNKTRPGVLRHLDGLAVHWYYDDIFAPDLIDLAHQLMPDKLIINTESCVGDRPYETHGPELGSWERGEKYVRSYLQDLQHSFNGWIDWNLILDERGGPNYVNNFVDAPIIVNTTNRREFYKQPIYYAIGHFSKFIPEGSVRIGTQLTSTNINAVAFELPDDKRVAVVLANSAENALDVVIEDSVRGKIAINIPGRSVHTLVYN